MIASAPRLCNVFRTSGLRPAATTRAAPRSLAILIASLPVTPVAPRTRTFSPGTSRARVNKRKPGGDTGVGESGCGFVTHTFRYWKGESPPYNRALRHRTIRWPRSAKKYALTIVEMPHSVRAADKREFVATRIVRTIGQLLVNGFKRRGINMYEYLSIAGNWLRERFTSWCLSQRA